MKEVTLPPLVYLIIVEVENSRIGNFQVETGQYGFITVTSSDLFVAFGKSEIPSYDLNVDFPVKSPTGDIIGNLSIRYDKIIKSETDRFTFYIGNKCSITLRIQTISGMDGPLSTLPPIQLPEILVVGHRGSGMNSVTFSLFENSIRSYNAAIENGADGVETDVHLSSDKTVVVNHNYDVEFYDNGRCHYSKSIRRMTKEEFQDSGLCTYFQEKRPLFKDVLANLKPEALLDIEVKYDEDIPHPYSDRNTVIRRVLEDISLYGGSRDIFFCTFDTMTAVMLAVTQSRYPVIKLTAKKQYNTHEDVSHVLKCLYPLFKWAGVFGFEFDSRYVTIAPQWITDAKKEGFAVMTWGDKNTELWEVEWQVNHGVSGFITDNVPLTKTLLEKIRKNNQV